MVNFKLTEGVAYYIGKNIKTERHSHHALEFIFGIEQTFDLISDKGTFNSVKGVVINPNYPHQFIGADAHYLFIFLEPELLQANQIKKYYDLVSHKIIQLNNLSTFPNLESVVNFSFFVETLKIPIILTELSQIDNRIKDVLKLITSNLSNGKISSNVLAKSIHLSESRFSHLFKEQIDIPVRKYILWCRIQEAMKQLLTGSNLTESAYAAGFSDSAHLSRTFLEMFGVPPSSLLKS